MGLEEHMLPCVRPRQPELRRILSITWNTCLKTKAEHDVLHRPRHCIQYHLQAGYW